MEKATDGIVEAFLAQGILGAVVLALGIVVILLYREKRQDAEKHDAEVASERKLNLELQQARIDEMKAGLEAVNKATDTIDNTAMQFREALSTLERQRLALDAAERARRNA